MNSRIKDVPMVEIPDEIYYKIFSYLLQYKYLVLFKDIKLHLWDYSIIHKTLHYRKLNSFP